MNEGEGIVAKAQDCKSWFLSGTGNVEKQSYPQGSLGFTWVVAVNDTRGY